MGQPQGDAPTSAIRHVHATNPVGAGPRACPHPRAINLVWGNHRGMPHTSAMRVQQIPYGQAPVPAHIRAIRHACAINPVGGQPRGDAPTSAIRHVRVINLVGASLAGARNTGRNPPCVRNKPRWGATTGGCPNIRHACAINSVGSGPRACPHSRNPPCVRNKPRRGTPRGCPQHGSQSAMRAIRYEVRVDRVPRGRCMQEVAIRYACNKI